MRFCFFLIWLVSSVTYASPRVTDLSGEWTGVVKSGKKRFLCKLTLVQTNAEIEGLVELKTAGERQYFKYQLNGLVDREVVIFEGIKIIEKKGLWCMATYELVLSEDEELKLDGVWKPLLGVKGGCIIGGGEVNLVKSRVPEAPIKAEEEPEEEVVSADLELNLLVEALRERQYYGLIIGVDEYASDDIVSLNNPIKDASSLYRTLVSHYTFEPGNLELLSNPTRSELIEALDRLAGKVSNVDNVLIFYAGHGIWDEKIEQGYWLPSDASNQSKAQWISNGTIRDYIRAIDAKHTLLIADACFSGGILKERGASLNSKAMLEIYKLKSRKAMTSGSLKTVPDESVFIKYLVKGLETNEDQLLTADQLFSKFKIGVINNSPNNQVPQYGAIHLAEDEGGDFIFLKKD